MNKDFFSRDAVIVAKELLGWYLVHNTPNGRIVGKIVETEAYHDKDPASHSFRGKTKRNNVMFGKAGNAYVYFVYGMYYCFNVVTDKEGVGSAALIRALEPIEGVELMKKFRNVEKVELLCNGPAKLVMAFNISKVHNGHDLSKEPLFLIPKKFDGKIVSAKRIGISKGVEELYRFYIKDSPYVSRK